MNSNIEHEGNGHLSVSLKVTGTLKESDYKKKLFPQDNHVFINFINWYNIPDATI
jgi:hypothetical protein